MVLLFFAIQLYQKTRTFAIAIVLIFLFLGLLFCYSPFFVAEKEGFYPFAVPDILLRRMNRLAFCRPLHIPAPSLPPPPVAVRLGSPLPVTGARVRFIFNKSKKATTHFCVQSLFAGGEGGIRTLAPVTRPTPLAGAPLRPA